MTRLAFNRRQSRRVDELAIGELGMFGLVLMENAGRGVADALERLQLPDPLVICCGRGNNAGDGFVVARHWSIRGRQARVVVWADPAQLSPDAAANFRLLPACEVDVVLFGPGTPESAIDAALAPAGTLLDCLLGTGAVGPPQAPLDQAIARINAAPGRRVAVDLPSGFDCDTGQTPGQAVRAEQTLTFVAPKIGFFVPSAPAYIGSVQVVDIGVPRSLIDRVAGES